MTTCDVCPPKLPCVHMFEIYISPSGLAVSHPFGGHACGGAKPLSVITTVEVRQPGLRP